MKNERGLTLVELLAVLVILGFIMMLLGTVLVNGMKASNRTTTNQQLQQEANYIVERVRSEYLKLPKEVTNDKFKLEIVLEIDTVNQTFKMNDEVVSEGYIYNLKSSVKIPRTGPSPFYLTIEKDGKSFDIDTVLSKLP